MSSKAKHLSSRTYSEQTLESEPRSLPKKIVQSSIKHNYENLLKIPTIFNPQFIRHLYLSHNKICTLQGIEAFCALESINISYNCLSEVQEMRKISNPHLLKHLKIRMNPFPYGYQDYFISIFPQLKTFDDYKLSKDCKQLHKLMRDFLSKNILLFYLKANSLMKNVNRIYENKQNDFRKENKQFKYDFVDQIKHLILRLKSSFIFPTSETLRNMTINQLLTLTTQVVKSVCEHIEYKQRTQTLWEKNNTIFREIFETILIKFSSRNDICLINHLHKVRKQQNKDIFHIFSKLGVFNEEIHPIIEAKMSAGAIKESFLTEKSAKFIKRQQNEAIINHSMNKLANWQCPQFNSLIPWEKTKMYNIFTNKNQQKQQDCIYEQIPLFIYCKQYLEVIAEIILEKASEILNLQSIFTQINQRKQSTTLNTETKTIMSPFIVQDSLDLQISMSDTMSFGQQQFIQLHHFDSKHQITLQKHEQFKCNVSKYSLYQINLAFKVFCTLKRLANKKLKKLESES